MNDDFLCRPRTQPPPKFSATLKTKLDLQIAKAASGKRLLYVFSVLVGTAIIFISTPVREFVSDLLNVFSGPNTASTQIDAPVSMPLRKNLEKSSAVIDTPEKVATSILEGGAGAVRSAVRSDDLNDLTSVASNASVADLQMNKSLADFPITSLSDQMVAYPVASYIRISGSNVVFPITAAVAGEFHNRGSGDARVVMDFSGTGGGFKKFCRGETDISNAARPILRAEMQVCAAAGIKYIEVPVAYHALAVVVNTYMTWLNEITISELKTMWHPAAQGSVTHWNRVNVEWPNQPLKLIGPTPYSITFEYFTEAVNGVGNISRRDFSASDDNDALAQVIAQKQNALGFVGYAYYAANIYRMKALKIVNSAGRAVSPSDATILDGTYHPLSRALFIYVNAKSAMKPEVQEFVALYLSKGPAFVRALKYVPLKESTYQTALLRFHDNKLGTVFGGIPTVGFNIEEELDREGEL